MPTDTKTRAWAAGGAIVVVKMAIARAAALRVNVKAREIFIAFPVLLILRFPDLAWFRGLRGLQGPLASPSSDERLVN